jgi:hypothetical protein
MTALGRLIATEHASTWRSIFIPRDVPESTWASSSGNSGMAATPSCAYASAISSRSTTTLRMRNPKRNDPEAGSMAPLPAMAIGLVLAVETGPLVYDVRSFCSYDGW